MRTLALMANRSSLQCIKRTVYPDLIAASTTSSNSDCNDANTSMMKWAASDHRGNIASKCRKINHL